MEENKTNIDEDMSQAMRLSSLLRAAEPYLSGSMRGSMDVLIKAVEFSSALQNLQKKKQFSDSKRHETEDTEEFDFDGLLRSVRNYCSKTEQDMIDKIISMQSTMKFMKTFQDIMSVMSELNPGGTSSGTSEETSGTELILRNALTDYGTNNNSGESTESGEDQGLFSSGMLDALEQMIPPEQRGMFETMKMLVSSGMLSNL